MTEHADAAVITLGRPGLICRSAYEAGQQNDNHCPKRRRSNTVRRLTSKAQVDPKVLQQSATDGEPTRPVNTYRSSPVPPTSQLASQPATTPIPI
jgi:hypothetical protein